MSAKRIFPRPAAPASLSSAAGCVGAGGAAPPGALRAEFWFDEIWSWEFARAAGSPWEIVAGPRHHHDNNHKLNTLYLWFCPDGVAWWRYRLHSFVAGLAAVGLAVLIARRRGRAEAVFAGLLFATNYWLAVASTEARGYALAVCFALLAFYALEGYFTAGGWRMLVLFWVSVILGFASHLTFIHCYLALGLWSVYHCARCRLPARAEIRELLACHAVPSLFFLVLYFVDVRRMQIGGAPPLPTTEVLGRLFSLGLARPLLRSGSSRWSFSPSSFSPLDCVFWPIIRGIPGCFSPWPSSARPPCFCSASRLFFLNAIS